METGDREIQETERYRRLSNAGDREIQETEIQTTERYRRQRGTKRDQLNIVCH